MAADDPRLAAVSDWAHALLGWLVDEPDLLQRLDAADRAAGIVRVRVSGIVAPFGADITTDGIQDVWDAFVKPDQDAGNPQSVEMRLLMAILRATYAALRESP